MNDNARQLKELLKQRKMTFELLAEASLISSSALSKVLSGRRAGRFTWARLQPVLSDEEQELVVQLWGPVFPARAPVAEELPK